jgi:acetolactate synthase-1/2/3 large subunit
MSTAGWSPLLGAPGLRIHVDIDSAKFNRAYAMNGVIENDLQTVLSDLLTRPAASRGHFPPSSRTSMVVQKLRHPSSSDGVHPGSLFKELSVRLPDDAAVFADIGNSLAWAFRELVLRHRQQLFVPLGLSSMGSALGAALGAATLWEDRCVVCVCGDCAALMHGAEFKTAAEYGIPLKIIVMNDAGPGMVHHGSRMIGLKNGNFRFHKRVDFEGYAKALGLSAFQICDDEQWRASTFERALRQPGPVLLDVWIDPDVEPPIADRARVLGQSESSRT